MVPWHLWSPARYLLMLHSFLHPSSYLSVRSPVPLAPQVHLPRPCPAPVPQQRWERAQAPAGMSPTGFPGRPASADHTTRDTIAMRLLGRVQACRPRWTSSLSNYAAVSRRATRLGAASSLCVASGPVTHQQGCTCPKHCYHRVCMCACAYMRVCTVVGGLMVSTQLGVEFGCFGQRVMLHRGP